MLNIRPAEYSDVNTIYKIGINTDQFETSSEVTTFWPKEILIASINQSSVLLYVAENNKEVIGFILVNLNNCLQKAEIENIVVTEPWRLKKVGSTLLEYTLMKIKELDYQYICALTKDAHKFFQKNDFNLGHDFKWLSYNVSTNFEK